jgi:hypothetical protein
VPARALRTGALSTVSYSTLSLIDGDLKLILRPARLTVPLDALVSQQAPVGVVPRLGLRRYEELLFDLAADPGETENLAATRRGDVSRTRTALFRQLLVSEQAAVASAGAVTLDEETRRELRALGYIR